ncbi:MAG: hypothetical protein IRZ21_06460 [Thermoleophilaceae bacterium]|nr:hypothetical protein [Thermoleophilaceae bacterium]
MRHVRRHTVEEGQRGGGRSDRLTLAGTWRRLGPEQRVAAIAALLLVVSTFGPFSLVEAAEILTALGVLALVRARAEGRLFHLPFGDGAVIAAAGVWSAMLIFIRLLDRPLGQNLLALVCAAILVAAGVRERARRGPDDLPEEVAGGRERSWLAETERLGTRPSPTPRPPRRRADARTEPLGEPPGWEGDPPTERLP